MDEIKSELTPERRAAKNMSFFDRYKTTNTPKQPVKESHQVNVKHHVSINQPCDFCGRVKQVRGHVYGPANAKIDFLCDWCGHKTLVKPKGEKK